LARSFRIREQKFVPDSEQVRLSGGLLLFSLVRFCVLSIAAIGNQAAVAPEFYNLIVLGRWNAFTIEEGEIMSGSGGGGWSEVSQDPCERLTSETTLTSPVQNVIAQLAPNTLLNVEIQQIGNTHVVRALFNGHVAGSITSAIIQRIAECIESGHEYVAEVLSIQGGACRVRVRIR
jgi:hypothetical protein